MLLPKIIRWESNNGKPFGLLGLVQLFKCLKLRSEATSAGRINYQQSFAGKSLAEFNVVASSQAGCAEIEYLRAVISK